MVMLGCKSNDSGSSEPAAEKPAAGPAKPAPAKGAAAPAGSKLSQVTQNMSPEQVQEIMGSPNGQGQYQTPKMWPPGISETTADTASSTNTRARAASSSPRRSGEEI